MIHLAVYNLPCFLLVDLTGGVVVLGVLTVDGVVLRDVLHQLLPVAVRELDHLLGKFSVLYFSIISELIWRLSTRNFIIPEEQRDLLRNSLPLVFKIADVLIPRLSASLAFITITF